MGHPVRGGRERVDGSRAGAGVGDVDDAPVAQVHAGAAGIVELYDLVRSAVSLAGDGADDGMAGGRALGIEDREVVHGPGAGHIAVGRAFGHAHQHRGAHGDRLRPDRGPGDAVGRVVGREDVAHARQAHPLRRAVDKDAGVGLVARGPDGVAVDLLEVARLGRADEHVHRSRSGVVACHQADHAHVIAGRGAAPAVGGGGLVDAEPDVKIPADGLQQKAEAVLDRVAGPYGARRDAQRFGREGQGGRLRVAAGRDGIDVQLGPEGTQGPRHEGVALGAGRRRDGGRRDRGGGRRQRGGRRRRIVRVQEVGGDDRESGRVAVAGGVFPQQLGAAHAVIVVVVHLDLDRHAGCERDGRGSRYHQGLVLPIVDCDGVVEVQAGAIVGFGFEYPVAGAGRHHPAGPLDGILDRVGLGGRRWRLVRSPGKIHGRVDLLCDKALEVNAVVVLTQKAGSDRRCPGRQPRQKDTRQQRHKNFMAPQE